jgi:hypothetical protein
MYVQQIPYIQIREGYILQYSCPDYDSNCRRPNRYNLHSGADKNKSYKGVMTEATKKRIVKAINKILILNPATTIYNPITETQQPFRLSFITLTIPELQEQPNGKETYQNLLKPWLRRMKEKHKLNNYIWKGELQKRGNIHYHITADTFIAFYHIRDEWNYLLRKHNLMNSYHKQKGDYNPNSTDVHAVQNIKDMAAYLCKYISKSYQNETSLGGKIWGQSEGLQRFKLPVFEIDRDIGHDLIDLMADNTTKVIQTDNCCIIKPQPKNGKIIYPQHLQTLITDHIKQYKQYEKDT